VRRTSINMPPYLCEICNKPRSKARGAIHVECSKILQAIRKSKEEAK